MKKLSLQQSLKNIMQNDISAVVVRKTDPPISTPVAVLVVCAVVLFIAKLVVWSESAPVTRPKTQGERISEAVEDTMLGASQFEKEVAKEAIRIQYEQDSRRRHE